MSDAYTPVPEAEPDAAPQEQRDPALSEDELLPRFKRWDKALDRHWAKWRKQARESFGFVEGDQWTDDERSQLEEIGKVAVTINRTGVMIDAVCGAEVNNRQQVQYVPREVGDSGANDVLTQGAEYFRDKADTETEESDAARDAFICGMGWTGTGMDYELDTNGLIMVDRVDPLEMAADAMARKANVVDARYLRRKKIMTRDAFEERWPGAIGTSDPDRPDKHVTKTGHGYEDDEDGEDVPNEDEVTVSEYQWYDLVPVHVVALGGKTIELSPQQMQQAMEVAGRVQLHLPSVMRKKRVYYRAFRSGNAILEAKPLPDGEFTYKCITGKRRRNQGTWYGLVEPMKDPQRWANKFFSEILFVLRTNANGGLIIEEDAVEDTDKFEENFAKADTNVYVPPGTVSGQKLMPKPQVPYPQGMDRLMEVANEAIPMTSGINLEMLGMVDREQAGVLEQQRKQAVYGILAAFFDSIRRYRKLQGRLMLKYINKYVPEGTLIRIVPKDGTAQFVPLAKSPETAEYDVIVDEAPTGPNQKEAVWAMFMQLFQMMKGQMPPDIIAEFLRYAPFPAATAEKLSQAVQKMAQPDPMQQQLQARGAMAKVSGDEAKARKDNADAQHTEAETVAMAHGAMMTGFAPA